jgi:Flp pilus assembly protein TadB
MEKTEETPSRGRSRSLSDYWVAFCGVMLVAIVVYAVYTA